MICPHCGNQTTNTLRCDVCGHSTEFAKRTNYRSVGTSSNGTELPQNFRTVTTQKKSKTALLPWLFGTIIVLLILCMLTGTMLSLVLKKLNTLSEQMESIQYSDPEENLQGIPTTTSVLETYMNPEAAAENTDMESIVTQEPPSAGLEEGNPKTETICILLDVNLTDKMNLHTYIPAVPQSIAIGHETPVLSDISGDSGEYIWVFTGWNTKVDGTGIHIEAGKIFDLPLSESITLYAQWEVQEHDEPPVG